MRIRTEQNARNVRFSWTCRSVHASYPCLSKAAMTRKRSEARPLRVLHLLDSLRVGGKERQAVELLKGLSRFSWVESMVVTMGVEQFYLADVEKLGVRLCYLLR